MSIKKFMTVMALSIAMAAAAMPGLPVYAGETAGQQVNMEADDDSVTTASLEITSGLAASYPYTGSAIQPKNLVVRYISADKKTVSQLTEGVDYTVTYGENNTNVGSNTASVTVTGTRTGTKYTDLAGLTVTKNFSITKATPVISLTNVGKTITYDGSASLGVEENRDFTVNIPRLSPTVEYYSGNKRLDKAPTNAGNYTAKISCPASDNTNAAAQKSINLTILPKDINKVTASLSSSSLSYTGKALEPAVTVVGLTAYDKTHPTDPYDYTVTYRNNTAVGTGYVDITGHGNYSGTKSLAFEITKAELDRIDTGTLTVTGINENGYAYTGSEIKPPITVKNGTTTLRNGTDYTLTYTNNIHPGTATITITGKGNYKNEKQVPFTINPADLDGVTISSIPNQTYTGDSIVPEVTVKKGNKTLVKGTDYTTRVLNGPAEDAGDYKLIIEAVTGEDASFSGSREIPFKIVAKSLSGSVFDIGVTSGDTFSSKTAFDYTGTNIQPDTQVYVNLSRSRAAEKLRAGTDYDYTVSYSNNVNVGTGTVTITGRGNYTGSLSKTFTIGQVKSDSINGAKINAISDQTYTGSAIKPGISVTLNGKSLSASAYDVNYLNNVNAGTATVYITGKGKYGGSAQATFKIKPANISSASVSGLTAQKYTGFAVQPSLILAYGGRTLREGTDYTLVFTDNAKLGNGKVAISGMGNFTGTVNKTFPITKQGSEGEKERVEATSFTLNKEYTTTSGGSVTLTPILTPENANKYQIRWSSGNSSFVFTNGAGKSTAITTESAPAVVKAADNGSTLITAELIVNGETAARAQTKVKVVRRFSDVPDGQYYSDAVNALANYSYEKDGNEITTPVINGTSSTTFTPSGAVTRAQFVMMLYNKATADYKAGKTSTDPSKAPASGFADVTSYTEAINWAVANGITFGKSKNQFDPNGTVTRAEAVTFLQRCLKGANGDTNRFTDVKSDAYYAGAVGWAVANGVTSGTSDTTFSPQQECNRAQAATFIYRALF